MSYQSVVARDRNDRLCATESPDTVRAMYFVTAAADPNLLPRLIEPFAKLGLVPERVHASREHFRGDELSVDLRLSGLETQRAQNIERSLRAMVGVKSVIAVYE